MGHWNPRAEILELSHRWQVIFTLFLVGSLVGWGVGLVLPSPYRAETSFYVGFNTDLVIRNPDDYKNWYLSQLEVMAVSDDLLHETLDRLRDQDGYWSAVNIDQLRASLGTYWRNAGRWRLVAEWADEAHAFQLGRAWSAVFLEQANQSISEAYRLIELEAQIKAASASVVATNLRRLQLEQIRAGLKAWQRDLTLAGSASPLGSLERWRLQSLAASLLGFSPIELALVDQFPPPDSPAQAYAPWVEQLIAAADSRIAALQEQSGGLGLQLERLQASLQTTVRTSNGLTANLVVKPFEDTLPAQPVRRNSQVAPVGGSLAVLAYALFWLARPLKKAVS
ncbi:MAG TPA: hypothetical protein VJL34_02290 [Anaerolineales bacterium]|nr:hypothetical protein [Anaerolineales bacterium]